MDPALIPALHDALVVAQTGSVGEAARRLNKTASAVSQQLRRIEQRFGVALFERVGRGLRPSPAGETVLGSLTRLFEEASSLEGLLDELATERVTTLRVAASDYLGEALLLPVLRRLAVDATPLRFDITTTNSVEAARLPGPGGKLMHAMIRIGGSAVMLVDEMPEWGAFGPKSLKGSPVTIHLYVEDADAVFARAVKAGAKVTMPLDDAFWGDRYGKLEDPFGHHWSVATHVRDVSPEEMQREMQKMSA